MEKTQDLGCHYYHEDFPCAWVTVIGSEQPCFLSAGVLE